MRIRLEAGRAKRERSLGLLGMTTLCRVVTFRVGAGRCEGQGVGVVERREGSERREVGSEGRTVQAFKPVERFFAARRRVPSNGTQEKGGPPLRLRMTGFGKDAGKERTSGHARNFSRSAGAGKAGNAGEMSGSRTNARSARAKPPRLRDLRPSPVARSISGQIAASGWASGSTSIGRSTWGWGANHPRRKDRAEASPAR
jgi:hypothetical protein